MHMNSKGTMLIWAHQFPREETFLPEGQGIMAQNSKAWNQRCCLFFIERRTKVQSPLKQQLFPSQNSYLQKLPSASPYITSYVPRLATHTTTSIKHNIFLEFSENSQARHTVYAYSITPWNPAPSVSVLRPLPLQPSCHIHTIEYLILLVLGPT